MATVSVSIPGNASEGAPVVTPADAPQGAPQGNQPQAPVPGTPEHDAAMAAKFDNRNGQQSTDAQRPEWLPPQYKSPEDFAKAHQELQAKYTQTSQELAQARKATSADNKAAQPNADAANATPDQAAQAVAQAGLDLAALQQEFAQNGELSDDSYAKLAGVGFTREVVDQYIDGQYASAILRQQTAFGLVGGEQNYRSMQQWARASLTPGEIAAFDRQVNGTSEEMQFAIQSLAARYQQARGSNPSLIQGQHNSGGAIGYRSTAEMMKDMGDPRYKSDPAFRADVERKVGVSQF